MWRHGRRHKRGMKRIELLSDPQSAKHALYIFLGERNWNQKNTSIAAQSYLEIKSVSGTDKQELRIVKAYKVHMRGIGVTGHKKMDWLRTSASRRPKHAHVGGAAGTNKKGAVRMDSAFKNPLILITHS